jgi:L-ribulokinase
MSYVLGLDYGTDSVRAVIVDTDQGKTIGQGVAPYPRWAKGLYCDPAKSQFRQHPEDYLDTLVDSVKTALASCPPGTGDKVVGISIDTTGSTPVLADADGTPLSYKKEFAEDPDALFILWKDHTSVVEAEEVNKLSAQWKGLNPVTYVGGIYSSEWFWAKALRVFKNRPDLAKEAKTILEHCDWMSAVLTGTKGYKNLKRSRCAAGHKALWNRNFGGYPDKEFFTQLHPKLAEIVETLGTETYTSDVAAGTITPEWAKKLGISSSCVVGVGAFDAHFGAVGAGIGPNQLAKVIGTSTCDILVAPPKGSGGDDKVVAGICGQVDGSVVPGTIGYEAGQSAFGDAYAWFKNLLLWPIKEAASRSQKTSSGLTQEQINTIEENLLVWLGDAAEQIDPEESGVLALDWLNGRRTPDADQTLRGAFAGLNLGSDAPRMFRALVEATAFGSRAIAERFAKEGVPIESVIALGGISGKSKLVMQILADVMNVDISVSAAEQACALGSAMYAAVVAGVYPSLAEAQQKMNAGFSTVYTPRPDWVKKYHKIYQRYLALGKFEEGDSQSRR